MERLAEDSTVALLLHERGLSGSTSQGSGVLCNVGGRTFVITARHCVQHGEGKWDRYDARVDEIAVGLLAKVIAPAIPGELVARVHVHPDRLRDVAVLELKPGAHRRWEHQRPLSPRTFRHHDAASPDDPVLFIGFPLKLRDTSDAVGGVGGMMILTAMMHGNGSPDQPPGDPGFLIHYSETIEDTHSERTRDVPPAGLSGGGVFWMSASGFQLLGIIRSRHDGILWCEPITAAMEILAQHDEPAVADEARDCLAELSAKPA